MENIRKLPNTFLKYKTLKLTPKVLKFLSGRHNTKIGTWGEIILSSGHARFEFLGKQDQVNLQENVKENIPFIVPPASWHRLIGETEKIEGCINFYCHPHSFFHKNYKLTKPHSNVVKLNDLYLKTIFDSAKILEILDLGCGRGRNSLYLSQFSHQIFSTDIDPEQLGALTNIIAEEAIDNIQVEQMDLEQVYIEKQFDVILLNVVLQFLAKDKVWPLLKLAQEHTSIGGLHSIVCPMKTPGMAWPSHFTFTLETNELRDFYLDNSWAILEYNEDFGSLHRLDENGIPISGRFASMIAQRVV
ncbi:MAG: hypothetical protein COA71_00030 [SAR86 cluster bacterium]|uniref:Uncharacterized protein n=1 Tax=SAR86 cluster bacterium TaxID=2030880 RepID=A0A2A5CIH4_9GAMM|nr:MAG: hypothetical protein COA71_00030 [SAR86 cluster bacterium]